MDVRWRTDESPTPTTEGGMAHPREDFSEIKEHGMVHPPQWILVVVQFEIHRA
jgi:hypothetical protein